MASPVQIPAVRPSGSTVPGSVGAEDLQFFDRAKRMLDGLDTYEEFLKLLRLYTMDIIDDGVLIDRAELFIGDGELLQQFKMLLRWDGRDRGPPGSIRTAAPEALPAFQSGNGAGPSYRRLSEKVQLLFIYVELLAQSFIGSAPGMLRSRSTLSVTSE